MLILTCCPSMTMLTLLTLFSTLLTPEADTLSLLALATGSGGRETRPRLDRREDISVRTKKL